MNVALVTPRFVKSDGQGRVNYEIVRSLLDSGISVTVIAREIATDFRGHSNFTGVTLSTRGIPSELLRSQVFSLKSAHWLKAHRESFDLIHVNGSVTLAPSDVNSVHFVHAAWMKSPVHTARVNRNVRSVYYWAATALHKAQERIAFSRSRCVVPVSQRVRGELLTLGVPTNRLFVIENGVDTAEFFPGSEARQKFGLPHDKFVGLFAGDMATPRKNLDTILHAVVALPQVHLAVVGSLEQNKYPAVVEALGIADRVSFLGFRRDMPEIMRSVDAFVFPSRYEPCGLVILEALASGLPVITASTVGGAEILDTSCGIVLEDPNDVAQLREAIARISNDHDLRKKMSVAARNVAEAHTWKVMATAYRNLYFRLSSAPSMERSA